MQQSFHQAQTSQAAFQGLLTILKRNFQVNSLVIFLYQDGRLRSSVYESTHNGLDELEKSNLSEPLVEIVWREGKPMTRRLRKWPRRLLPLDLSVAAAPIQGYGVLYLGRAKKVFLPGEVETLWLIARQTATLIESVAQRESDKKQLAFVSEEKRKLQRWVHRLHRLLEASRKIASATSKKEVLSEARTALEELIPHQYFLVLEIDASQPAEVSDSRWMEPEVRSLARQVRHNKQAILIDQSGKPRAESTSPHQQAKCFLVAPILPCGTVLFLADSQPGYFSQEHLNLISLVTHHMETAFASLDLRQEYISASKAAAVGQMAAGLSHELNTPLGAIQLSIESAAMLLANNPSRAKERLQNAESSIERAQQILKGLLYYATSYGVDRESVDLNDTVQTVLKQFDPSIFQFKEQNLKTRVKGFSLDLEQLLEQLFRNAEQGRPGSGGS